MRHLERFANAPFEVELYSNDPSVFIIMAHLRHYTIKTLCAKQASNIGAFSVIVKTDEWFAALV